jgi:hypothetical protein
MERENLVGDSKGKAASGSNREGESTEAERRGVAARRSDEGPVMGLERYRSMGFGPECSIYVD